jgi:hypothetical protein
MVICGLWELWALRALSLKAFEGFLFFGTYAFPLGVYIDWTFPGSNDISP